MCHTVYILMPELSFKQIQLDKQLSLSNVIAICSEFFGFAFLQDQQQPFIGLLPKRYQSIYKTEKSYVRRQDLSYQDISSSFEITFQTPVKRNYHGFNGGYICFISYDYAQHYHLKSDLKSGLQAFIGEYDIFIRKEDNNWILNIDASLLDNQYIQKMIQKFSSPIVPHLKKCSFNTQLQARWLKSDYQKAFKTVQNYLHAGDCYQINLTQEFSSQINSGKIFTLLPELMALTQAPYAGYIAFDDFELLSCSPELFIEFDKNRLLKTRPIKGTLPRGSTTLEDEKLKNLLAHSEKDQAENLMIVDLLRNDLSVYAETGSVKVPKLFEIESFAQVHHMVSEIHATLKPEVNPFNVLMSALPGGSITGAPKIRAMEIIDEIEGNNRGAYCGSLGYFNYDGTGRFNILIRSIQRYGDDVSVWAGGGITVASDVDAEYQETLDKVSAILDVLNQYVAKPNS